MSVSKLASQTCATIASWRACSPELEMRKRFECRNSRSVLGQWFVEGELRQTKTESLATDDPSGLNFDSGTETTARTCRVVCLALSTATDSEVVERETNR